MRTTLALLFFWCTFSLWGQQVSARIDLSNAFFGSSVNPPAFNWKIGISDNLNYNSLFRFGMEYEAFDYIDYQQWTFAKLDYEIIITDKISILPGIALSQIYHETTYSHDAMSYTFYLEATYKLNDFLMLSVQAERERASDITQIWRDSAYVGLIYYWNE